MKRHWLCLAIAALSVVAISATGLALADRGQLAGGPEREIKKEDAKGMAKAMAKGLARAIAPNTPEAATEEAAAAEEEVAEEQAAQAEREAAAAKAEESEAEAAAEKAAEAEREATAEEAAAEEETAAEEKTYTITLEHHVDPEYPEDARKDGVGGLVTLKLTLTPDGEVGNVFTLEEVEAYPSLTEAAELAAHQWTFKIEGDPEGDVEVIVPVEFKMLGEKTMQMSVSVPDTAEKPEEPDEPDAPAAPDAPEPADAPEPDEPPATDEVPEPEEP